MVSAPVLAAVLLLAAVAAVVVLLLLAALVLLLLEAAMVIVLLLLPAAAVLLLPAMQAGLRVITGPSGLLPPRQRWKISFAEKACRKPISERRPIS